MLSLHYFTAMSQGTASNGRKHAYAAYMMHLHVLARSAVELKNMSKGIAGIGCSANQASHGFWQQDDCSQGTDV